MDSRELRSLLDRIGAIRRPCDLDLLLFFYRHPCALLTAEQLVSYLGHDRERLAKSLEGLIEAGLVTRSQSRAHAARLYVLEPHALPGGLLSSFLRIAATRKGRLEAMRLLGAGPGGAPVARLRRRVRLTKVA